MTYLIIEGRRGGFFNPFFEEDGVAVRRLQARDGHGPVSWPKPAHI